MKNKYLNNLDKLFSDNNREIYEAILEKKEWLFEPLILNGNLDYYEENGQRHYIFLESLFNNTILLNSVPHKDNSINEVLKDYRKINFETKIKLDSNSYFYVEYDFSTIDERGYKELMPNFYHCHDLFELNIDMEKIQDDPKEQIKYCIEGREDQRVIVLNRNSLLNGAYFVPCIKKIYIAKKIPEELFIDLKRFSIDNKIILEVIYEDK